MMFFYFCFFIYIRLSLSDSTVKIWPLPNKFSRGNKDLYVSGSSFEFKSETPCKDLEDSFSRYKSIIFGEHEEESEPSFPSLSSVLVIVHNCNAELQVFLSIVIIMIIVRS